MKAHLIRLVHVGKTNLTWNDETYRDVLNRLTQKRSAKDCSEEELERVLDYMREHGFMPKNPGKFGKRPGVALQRRAVLAKIEALLAEAKRPWGYAVSMGKRMFGKERLEWLTTEQLASVMNALQYDAKRHGRPV